jgi:hypothetical protein
VPADRWFYPQGELICPQPAIVGDYGRMDEFDSLTVTDVAHALHMSLAEARALIDDGTLASTGGSRPRVRYIELQRFALERQERNYVLGINSPPVDDVMLTRPFPDQG